MSSVDLTGKHIVAIDDSTHSLDLIARILQSAGAQVNSFEDALLAYGYLRNPTYPVDALVTDVVIGSTNGIRYLNEMLAGGVFIPTVVVSGSQASRQMNRIFEQGYALEGNHIPLAFVTKRPGDFGKNLLTRLSNVLHAEYNHSKTDAALKEVTCAAQDGGLYRIAADAVDRYFALTADIALSLEGMFSQNTALDEQISGFQRLLDTPVHFSELVGMPQLELHKAAYMLQDLSQALAELYPKVGQTQRATLNYLQQHVLALGSYYHTLVDGEILEKARLQGTEKATLQEQLPPSAVEAVLSGQRTHPQRPSFHELFPAEDKPKYKILLAHDDGAKDSRGRRVFGELGFVDIAGVFEQAINALAARQGMYSTSGFDILIVHPKLSDDLAFSYHDSVEETVRTSNYPPELTEQGRQYLADAIERIDSSYPGIFEGFVGKYLPPEKLHHTIRHGFGAYGEYLAAVARVMHPKMLIAAYGAWSDEELEAKTLFRNFTSPYDCTLPMPLRKEDAQSILLDALKSL